ncbi:MAG: gas vesicle protein K [Acidobacteriota bacterium]
MKRPGPRQARPRARTVRALPKRSPRAPKKARTPRLQAKVPPEPLPLASLEVQEIESLRAELDRLTASSSLPRWNADPEDVRRSVAKLVLTLVEFIRQVLERQAIRRMEAGTLTGEQTESVGLALMRLEETVRDLGAQFGLEPGDLKLDLGPIGKLL